VDVKFAELVNLDTTLANSFGSRVKDLLANASNGIEKIFAREIETKKLCVADDNGNKTCITKSELDAVLLQASVNSVVNNTPPQPESLPVTEPVVEIDNTVNPDPQTEIIEEIVPIEDVVLNP
jgi:hypothetical protein